MNGTEKQIAWAQDIQKVVVEAIDAGLAKFVSDPRFDRSNPKMAQTIDVWEARKAAILDCNRAKDMIDLFKDVRMDAAPIDAFMQVCRTYKVYTTMVSPMTDGQMAIINAR